MNRENGRVTQSLRIGTAVYGIKAYAAERQPNGLSEYNIDGHWAPPIRQKNKTKKETKKQQNKTKQNKTKRQVCFQ